MYVEIIQDFQPLEIKKTSNDKNQRLPNITTPNVHHVSLTKSPVSTVSKGALTGSDIVNQKSILKQNKIRKEYNEIYNNTNITKRISKTSYKKLSCIYGEDDEREIIIKTCKLKNDLDEQQEKIAKNPIIKQ